MQVKGRKKVWTSKLKHHYRRLRNKTRLRGLLRWRKCALALHMAGIPVQSGTIPVERHWAAFKSYFPAAQKALKLETFNLLASLAFLRFNWVHFNKPGLPKWAQSDSILAERAFDILRWIEQAGQAEESPLIVEIQKAWEHGNHEAKPAERTRRKQVQETRSEQ